MNEEAEETYGEDGRIGMADGREKVRAEDWEEEDAESEESASGRLMLVVILHPSRRTENGTRSGNGGRPPAADPGGRNPNPSFHGMPISSRRYLAPYRGVFSQTLLLPSVSWRL
ncbi:hypothetical protein ACLOJK_003091 [Asimina triloba]